jgi:uncharacterized protein (TIGR01244 family)
MIPCQLEPVPGRVVGGQPTAADLAAFAATGGALVINLRNTTEDLGYDEAATAAALGLRYLSLPVAGAAGVTPDNARALSAAIAGAAGGVMVHCATGNRVGGLFALAAGLEGAPVDDAIALGRAHGMVNLDAHVRALLGG